MDRDDFLKKLQAVAVLGSGRNGRNSVVESGPVIESFKPTPGACRDCGLLVDHTPKRVYAYKGRNRTAKCVECKRVQNQPGGSFDSYYLFTRPKE